MAANRHDRQDVTLTARLTVSEVELQLGAERLWIARETLANPDALIGALSLWTPLRAAALQPPADVELHRIVVRVEDLELSEVDWEAALRGIAPGNILAVRVCDVQPRVTQRLFDFPARILALGRGHRVAEAVATVLDSRSDYAMTVKTASVAQAEGEVERAKWPVVDVLHFQHEADRLLTRTDAEKPGSVRWLLRRCDRWKTRLIVIEAPADKLPALRRAAQTIVACGGPAVFVFDRATFRVVDFYADLLHDRPLDWIQYWLGGTLFGGAGREEALRFSAVARYLADPRVVKALRARARRQTPAIILAAGAPPTTATPKHRVVREAVRQSARTVNLGVTRHQLNKWEHPAKYIRFGDVIGSVLLDAGWVVPAIHSSLTAARDSLNFTVSGVSNILRQAALPLDYVLDPRTPPKLETLVADKLNEVRASGKQFQYNDSEAKGTLPLAAKATALRKLLRTNAAAVTAEQPHGPRHVNTRFYRTTDEHELQEIPQPKARLTRGELVHLGIRIGEKDQLLENIGDLVFADESIPWTPDMAGIWIEVALTPIDFENLGDPVQEFWLPRGGEAPLITFAVRPKATTTIPGVARLRFTFYHRNNILQSFRVAVHVDGAGPTRKALSAALDADPALLGNSDAGYLTRLEYSAADPAAASSLPARTLSIVANESAGEKIFSIKTQDFFSTTINRNTGERVKNARDALLEASHNKNGEYDYDDDNTGTASDADLLARLWPIAERGFALYFSILPDPDSREEVRQLLGSGGTIAAAHVDLRQIVAWSLIYDRELDENHTEHHITATNTDIPVDRAVCRAAFPDAKGQMPPGDCITDPKCILHEKAVADRVAKTGRLVCPETVVCPRRFWGFMHEIEVPAQQVQPNEKPQPMPQVVAASKPAGILAGFNPTLQRVIKNPTHISDFTSAVTKAGAALLGALQKRNALVQSFDDFDPDVVYLYCHAYPDTQQKPATYDPNLDFGQRQIGEYILVHQLAGKKPWTHAPLVFLNACGVAGFTADAPSEFITTFVQARHAAAVIGTEVTVWEELATEVALNVLGDFLMKKPAGQALLRARRVLLAKNNPLGLVYTLYGSAALHLA